jgi:hypothetical protein
MVWAGISIDNRTDLVVVPGRLNAMNYIENILEDHMVPAAYGVGQNFIPMQDNESHIPAASQKTFYKNLEFRSWNGRR